jgi:hypothetical protein
MNNMLKRIYNSKWFPRLFYVKPDGGKDSGVTVYFLIEWKVLFSIGLLHFKEGSREAYHSHAFNALSWFIKGRVTEEKLNGEYKEYAASFKPKYTPKDNFHKVFAHTDTWCLTLRGAWEDTWLESRAGKVITLTHGRKEI